MRAGEFTTECELERSLRQPAESERSELSSALNSTGTVKGKSSGTGTEHD